MDKKSGAFIGGLYRMAGRGDEVDLSPDILLKVCAVCRLQQFAVRRTHAPVQQLVTVAYHVHIADAVAVIELQSTFQSDVACDAAAVFPLVALGGAQFSITFTVNS